MQCQTCGEPTVADARLCLRCSEIPASEATSAGTVAPGSVVPGAATAIANRLDDMLRAAGGAPQVATLAPGSRLGRRYEIARLLGKGGMGQVYLARDRELNREVALKLIAPHLAADPSILDRFKREVHLSSVVTHPNVLRVYDLGESGEQKFLSMQYIEGQDLADVLRREKRLPLDRVTALFRQICEGLAAAHAKGVLHRDLKPQNVMIDAEGRAYVTDFGLAVSASASAAHRPGEIVGTPHYMSPEQVRGEALDARSDIFTLGVILYELLTGERPYAGETPLEIMIRRTQAPPRPAKALNPEVTPDLARILDRCLAIDLTQRYASVADILVDLGDEGSAARRAMRRWRVVAAAMAIAVVVVGVVAWLTRPPLPAAEHEPVSVVIADFANRTGDATFDRTLEPMLKIALEDAKFIVAFDRNAIRRSLGAHPPDALDERAAREIAVHHGLGVVLAGSLALERERYQISVRALHAVTGQVLASLQDGTSSKDKVLAVAAKLAAGVRRVLGDQTPDSAKRFATETLSATSLPVVQEYAAAAEAMSRSRFEEAFQHFSRSVSLDPSFGLGHAGMAISSRNLDRQQDAERYIQEAVRHLNGMTERERYRTRGLYYFLTRDYPNCVKEFGDLIARYSADASARNNLALCSTYLRNWPRALEEMRTVVRILPRRTLYRVNLALYAAYSGDAETAETEARATQERDLFGMMAVAFSQLLHGRVREAAATYEGLGEFEQLGASYRASGLADLALYEGRLSDAASAFAKGAEADRAAREHDRAANKLAALAWVRALQRREAEAVSAADQALKASTAAKIRFLCARVFVEVGAVARARALAAELAAELQPEPQAYGKVVEGAIALRAGDARQAVKALTEANALLDTWLGHFELGRAYLEARAYPQADSELERCLKRRGEALALFLDEEPTFGLYPLVHYYQGRVREALGDPGFVDAYRAYLAIRGESKEDPLIAEVRRRAGR